MIPKIIVRNEKPVTVVGRYKLNETLCISKPLYRVNVIIFQRQTALLSKFLRYRFETSVFLPSERNI